MFNPFVFSHMQFCVVYIRFSLLLQTRRTKVQRSGHFNTLIHSNELCIIFRTMDSSLVGAKLRPQEVDNRNDTFLSLELFF